MNIIGKKYIFITLSSVVMVASIVCIIIFGFQPAIDFTGGSLWQVRITAQTPLAPQDVKDFFMQKLNISDAIVYKDLSSDSFMVKTKPLTEEQHQQYLKELSQIGSVSELRFESIGPTIGDQLRSKSIWAGILVLIGISLYIAFAFRKISRPVASWKYGIVTLIALLHDVAVPAAIISILGVTNGVEFDSNFVVALLVIMGFSVHDTIVVFDRIRENLLAKKGTVEFDTIVNDSINQTMARSINTSLTLVLVLVAMVLFGTPHLRLFVLIMLIGTVVGTYSSIFIASPLLTIWQKFGKTISTTKRI